MAALELVWASELAGGWRVLLTGARWEDPPLTSPAFWGDGFGMTWEDRGMSTTCRTLSREPRLRPQQPVSERRRLAAAALFTKGLSSATVARRLGVSRQSAHRWCRAWQAGGVQALRTRGPIGRHRKLTVAHLDQLEHALLLGAVAHGNPCTGDPGAFTITYTGVFHTSQNAAGGTRTTGTLTGTFVFDTTDPTRPDFTGRFTQTFGDNTNSNNQLATSTFRVRGTGTDGSTVRFHTVAHITAETIDASTDPPTVTGVKVKFDRLRCG